MTPTTEHLKQFLLGTLPAPDAARVAAWIEADQNAVAVLERLDGNDDLANAFRRTEDTPHLQAGSTEDTSVLAIADRNTFRAEPLPTEFRFVRELGRGGMGVVLEAEDTRLGRRVAVKQMLPGIAALPEAKARFLREARAMAAVESDHIVPVLHVGETADGSPYLVMPLLAGETLSARLDRGPLSADELRLVARDTALGLAAAHARGLIHRDIKPSNLWLEAHPDGTVRRVRVLDFGLAKPTTPEESTVTNSNAVVGTPQYMSPEQARAEKLGPPTDLFSLGSVLYRAATGKQPFPGETMSAVLTALAVDEPRPVRELDPSIPTEIADLIHALLRKEPGRRPTTDDVIRRLAPATVAPPRPPRRGSRVWVAAAAAALVAILALGIVIIVRDKTGKEVGKIEVPDGGSVDKEENGKTTPLIQPAPAVIPPGGPSPLGKLDAKAIPPEELPDTVPDGLVAVLGSRQCRSWTMDVNSRIAFRPDGNQVVYPDEAGWGSFLDVKTGRRTKLPVKIDGYPLVYSADGSRILHATYVDGKLGIQIVDVSGKEPKPTSFLPADPKWNFGNTWQRSADGKTVCTGGHYLAETEVTFDWPEADKLAVRCTIPRKVGFTSRISADGKTLAIRSHTSAVLEVWDVAGKEAKKRVELPGEEGKLEVNLQDRAFDFLPDGRLVAVHADKKMRVWDVSGEKPTATLVESWKEIATLVGWNVRVAPSGDTVAVFDEGFIHSMTVPKAGAAFGAAKSASLQVLKLDGQNIGSLEFSADGKRALTTHIGGYFVVWDVTADGFVVHSAPRQSYFVELGISPDGKMLIGGSQHQATRYEFGDAAPKPMKAREVYGLRTDLRLAWGVGGYYRPLDADNSKTFDVPEANGFVAWDDSSSMLLNCVPVAGQAGQRRWRCWDVSTDKPTKIAELKQSAEQPVLLFAGGKHVISKAGYDGAKKVSKYTLWTNDGGTYKPTDTFEMAGEGVPGMASSPDGKRVATITGQVYDVADGKIKLLKRLGGSSVPRIYRPVFSPDGKKLAFPGQVTVWDIDSELRDYQWPAELNATKVLFAPDGRHVITANANGTAFVIRLATGKK